MSVTDISQVNDTGELKDVVTGKRDYTIFKQEFDNEIYRASDSFVRIGYLLKEARDTGILEGSGYATMSDFAKTEYGLSPDQTSRFINVYERFGDGEGHLKTEYLEHGQTKLIEMLSLPDSVAESIPAELPREDIRQIRQEVKEEQQVTPIERAIEDNDIPEGLTDLEAFIFVHLRNRETFTKFWESMKKMEAYDIESLLAMIEPSGIAVLSERLPRRGRILLSFNGTSNKPAIVDVREDTRTEIEWDELHTALSMRLYPGDVISDSAIEDYAISYGPIEEAPEAAVSHESDQKEDDTKPAPEDIGTPEESGGPSDDKNEEIAPAQFMNEPEEVEESYCSKAKKAAASLDEAVLAFIRDCTDNFIIASDLQEQMDRIEVKVAVWRNVMIEWRRSKE